MNVKLAFKSLRKDQYRPRSCRYQKGMKGSLFTATHQKRVWDMF